MSDFASMVSGIAYSTVFFAAMCAIFKLIRISKNPKLRNDAPVTDAELLQDEHVQKARQQLKEKREAELKNLPKGNGNEAYKQFNDVDVQSSETARTDGESQLDSKRQFIKLSAPPKRKTVQKEILVDNDELKVESASQIRETQQEQKKLNLEKVKDLQLEVISSRSEKDHSTAPQSKADISPEIEKSTIEHEQKVMNAQNAIAMES